MVEVICFLTYITSFFFLKFVVYVLCIACVFLSHFSICLYVYMLYVGLTIFCLIFHYFLLIFVKGKSRKIKKLSWVHIPTILIWFLTNDKSYTIMYFIPSMFSLACRLHHSLVSIFGVLVLHFFIY